MILISMDWIYSHNTRDRSPNVQIPINLTQNNDIFTFHDIYTYEFWKEEAKEVKKNKNDVFTFLQLKWFA